MQVAHLAVKSRVELVANNIQFGSETEFEMYWLVDWLQLGPLFGFCKENENVIEK